MKKNVQFQKGLKALFLVVFSCCALLLACKKTDTPVEVPATAKNAKFSMDVNGTATSGTEFLEDSYMTTNDEFLATPYAEIHIVSASSMLDVMIANPTVKQYSFSGTNTEAAVLLNVNGEIYEATTTSVLNITEASTNKIGGTVSGTFKNVNNASTVQVTNGSFLAQF